MAMNILFEMAKSFRCEVSFFFLLLCCATIAYKDQDEDCSTWLPFGCGHKTSTVSGLRDSEFESGDTYFSQQLVVGDNKLENDKLKVNVSDNHISGVNEISNKILQSISQDVLYPNTNIFYKTIQSLYNTDVILPKKRSEYTKMAFSSSKSRKKRRVGHNLLQKEIPNIVTPASRFPPLGRKHPAGNAKIDDIIQGIMKLLGGNVKLKAPSTKDTRVTTFGNGVTSRPMKTRINNRGPPRMPSLSFGGMLPHGDLMPPPIRKPITPPPPGEDSGGPMFVANTRPPFPVPLPPGLEMHLKKDGVTAIPIPEDVLSGITSAQKDEVLKENVTTKYIDVTETSSDSQISSTSSSKLSSTTSSTTPSPPTTTPILFIQSSMEDDDELTSKEPSKIVTETPKLPTRATSSLVPSTETVSTTRVSHPNDVIPLISDSKPSKVLSPSKTNTFSKSSKILPVNPTKSSVFTTNQSTISPTPSSKNPQPSTMPMSFGRFPPRLPGPLHPQRPSLQKSTTQHRGVVINAPRPLPSTYNGEVITAATPDAVRFKPNIFDVTVSALQGYGKKPAIRSSINRYKYSGLITKASRPGDGSVYIDGRRTYFDLSPNTANGVKNVQTMGVGTVIPEKVLPPSYITQAHKVTHLPRVTSIRPKLKLPSRKTNQNERRPPTLGPPKRIDTCIVGFDATCDASLGEICRTEGDVSSCFCKPGTARRRPRTNCKESVLLQVSLKVDRLGERHLAWGSHYANSGRKEYQRLAFEAQQALDSAFGESRYGSLSAVYLGNSVQRFYSLGGRLIVNSTVQLARSPQTTSPSVTKNLQRHLIRVIKANNNYVGNSRLSVEGPLNPVPDVSDVNECFDSSLFDCAAEATCTNTFGGYSCICSEGFTDRYPDDRILSGRYCDSCPRNFCSKKGECRIQDGQNVCLCDSSYYGSRCEIDGEVIAVAVGASVAAVVIIVLTLVFLCLWSQRWKARDRKAEIVSRFPGVGFFGAWRGGALRGPPRDPFAMEGHQKVIPQVPPGPYNVSMEDRIRWAQMTDSMAHQQNIYAQPEQMRSAAPFYQDQRKVMPGDYASIASVSGFPQQHFGMQQLNPQFLASQNHFAKTPYSQFGPSSLNSAASVCGVSRAPTLAARTPLPVRDLLGSAVTLGPLGGGVAAKGLANGDGGAGLLTESSEDDPDRPYHLPRPKSRSSAALEDDFYCDPDLLAAPPLPAGPPPPHPFHFDQFFKSKFP